MPETALRALPLLERALTLEPDYALAHGHAAFCYENLFVRDGRRDENRLGAIRHAHAAIAYGRDDATALTLGGFNLGMIECSPLNRLQDEFNIFVQIQIIPRTIFAVIEFSFLVSPTRQYHPPETNESFELHASLLYLFLAHVRPPLL